MKKYLIAIGLVLTLTVMPTVAGAQTMANLQALIASLQAQIVALTAQLNQQAGSCKVLVAHDVSFGDEDNAADKTVTALQKYLERQGYLNMPAGANYGFFGRITLSAVGSWQKANGVINNGTAETDTSGFAYVGPYTRSIINSCSTPTPLPLPVPIPPTNELTANKILNSNGFVNGELVNTCYPPAGVKCDGYSSGYLSKNIVFGQLDSDLAQEAITTHTVCGASCGEQVAAFKLVNGNVLMVDLPDSGVSGALQNIDLMKIRNDGVIIVTGTDNFGSKTNYYRVSLINGVLKAEKISSPSSITLLSPKNGDTLIIGQPYTFRWQTTGISSDALLRTDGGAFRAENGQQWDGPFTNNMINDGQETVVIPITSTPSSPDGHITFSVCLDNTSLLPLCSNSVSIYLVRN